MISYKNKKTGSTLNFPDNGTISDIDTATYLMKMLVYNDNRILNNNISKLTNCLTQVISIKKNEERLHE